MHFNFLLFAYFSDFNWYFSVSTTLFYFSGCIFIFSRLTVWRNDIFKLINEFIKYFIERIGRFINDRVLKSDSGSFILFVFVSAIIVIVIVCFKLLLLTWLIYEHVRWRISKQCLIIIKNRKTWLVITKLKSLVLFELAKKRWWLRLIALRL